MKKILISSIITFCFLTGCSQTEKETHYTPNEIKQILLDNDFKFSNPGNGIYIYYNDRYAISMLSTDSFTIFEFFHNNDKYGENWTNSSTNCSAEVYIDEDACLYSFTEKKLSESSPSSCGQLAIEKSQKIKQEFENLLQKIGISKQNFYELVNDPR